MYAFDSGDDPEMGPALVSERLTGREVGCVEFGAGVGAVATVVGVGAGDGVGLGGGVVGTKTSHGVPHWGAPKSSNPTTASPLGQAKPAIAGGSQSGPPSALNRVTTFPSGHWVF